MDGDSYLLYYASIDIAGNSQSNKCRNQNPGRGLVDDFLSSKKRFRIPVKGRIQLVLCLYPPYLLRFFCFTGWIVEFVLEHMLIVVSYFVIIVAFIWFW